MATTTIYPSKNSSSHRSSIPRLNIDAAMSSQPAPAPAPAPPSPKPGSSHGSNTPKKPGDPKKETYRLLSHNEWVQFCKGIGVFKDDESEEVVRPISPWWPPKGYRDGLYQDVLVEKTKFTYFFHIVSTITWFLMLLQIAMSAVLTALGSVSTSSSTKEGTAIVRRSEPFNAVLTTPISNLKLDLHRCYEHLRWRDPSPPAQQRSTRQVPLGQERVLQARRASKVHHRHGSRSRRPRHQRGSRRLLHHVPGRQADCSEQHPGILYHGT